MLWYGLVYYVFAAFSLFIFTAFFLRLMYVGSAVRFDVYAYLVKTSLSFVIVFGATALALLYYALAGFEDFCRIPVSDDSLALLAALPCCLPLSSGTLGTSLIAVYYFPFIYIFILITVLSVLFCLAYSVNELAAFALYCTLILASGYTLFFTDSLVLFFFSYEMLLVPSFFILYRFAKTRRCIEAAFLMFFWTQFGALFLAFSFLYLFFICGTSSFAALADFQFSQFELNFLFTCWIIGFGVKLPLWPFYGWLPKAHVEASTNFSIFLSGVLVKFAFFGLLKCLITVELEPTLYFIYPFLVVGIVDAGLKLFYQIDLKKLVAYSTVVEMHWLTMCTISGQSCLMLAGFCMLISHALLSTNSFLLVDAINRRFKTRLITEISGIGFACPKLFFLCLANCLVFLGFPGSITYVAEFLFFSFLFDLLPLLCVFLVILLYLIIPTFFFRSWTNVLFGLSANTLMSTRLDLNSKESLVYGGILLLMFWLGLSWQMFIF